MRKITYAKLSGLCLAGLCTMAVVAFGVAGTASAAGQLLFRPTSGLFPYHLTGTGGKSLLEAKGGATIESPEVHALVLAINSTLFNTHIEFLKVFSKTIGASCHNDGTKETVLVDLLGHLGLADPGDVPATLLLLPNGGFEFSCGIVTIKVAGEIIGHITAPAINQSSELLTIQFLQSKGIQEFTTFLLGSQTLTNQFETSKILGEEQSAQEGEITLHALPGQGTFLLLTP